MDQIGLGRPRSMGERARRLGGVLLPLRFRPIQYGLYVAGCLLFSIGATCFIEADLGADPLDVFAVAVRDTTFLTVGLAQGGFAALMLVVWTAIERRAPSIWPFITFLACGSIIDILLATAWLGDVPIDPFLLMVTGVVACAFGSAYIIMSGMGIRAMDLLALALAERLQRPFWVFKAVLEVLLLGTGWLLGGTVGIGTVFFLIFVGFLIQPVMSVNHRVARLPNFALDADLLTTQRS